MGDVKVTLTEAELKKLVKDAVTETLTSLGIDSEDPFEMQADFQHLRNWRRASQSVRKKALLTLVTILISGWVAAVVMYIKG